MKIAMIGHKRIPGREGGVEVVVEELATRMAALGHQVYVYNRKSKKRKSISLYKGVNIISIPTIENKNTDAFVYSFLASIHALFCKYDVIHYHALGPSVMLIIPHIFHIKTVVTVHGLNYKTPKWKGFGAKYIHLGEIITAKYADEIIVLSKEQKEYFKTKYNRETTYIPNGVTMLEKTSAKLIKEKWELEEQKYILFVSRIVPGKGIEHLIEAYKQIKTDIPLILIGESNYVEEFYQQIRDFIKDDSRIRMLGFANMSLLAELYSNAFLFVFPSEAEGMPMCLLEALSFDTPCLVSDIAENTEVGNEFVQSFHTGDVDDLKKKLEYCIENKAQLFNKSSRSYVEKNYDWTKVVKKTLQCYET